MLRESSEVEPGVWSNNGHVTPHAEGVIFRFPPQAGAITILHMTRTGRILSVLAALISAVTVEYSAIASDENAQSDFFERHVRPVLISRCLECHGPDAQESGLRVDSLEHLLTGGDLGPAVVPGNSGQSRLIQAIRRGGELAMPPDVKLPSQEISVLEHWIQTGAFWPPNETLSANLIDASTHWAFLPIQDPPLPATEGSSWPRTSVDAYIQSQLDLVSLVPSEAADRGTLLHRLTFDLLGLPPTYEDVHRFVNDPAPNAYTRVVDQLLASPRYGERWGRHWLDVARYSDTKGFAYFEDLNYPYAWSYRDYVINAFNEDVPYDEFVTQQLAADHLPQKEFRQVSAALGFLTVGQRFSNNLHDVLDDRIDVVTRGLMGLTVACARCHDHKYDPIPTADYYSLYGIFRSSAEPLVGPVVGDPPDTVEFRTYEEELQKRVAALTEFATKKHAELVAGARQRAGEYLLAAQQDEDSGVVIDNFMIIVDPGELNPTMRLRWQSLIRRTRRLNHPVLSPWHTLAAFPQDRFAAEAKKYAASISKFEDGASVQHINPIVAAAIRQHPPESLKDAAKLYGNLLVETDSMWQMILADSRKNGTPEPEAFPDSAWEELRQILYASGAPANIPLPDIGFNLIRLLPDRVAQEEVQTLLKAVEEWAAQGANLAPRAMILRDSRPHEPRVFHRGNPAQPRQRVPRQFLEVVAGRDRRPFTKHGSGRLELAREIVSPTNPLTARVIVNRIWMHHFGKPLVRTPSDFGLRSEAPQHQALLDHLASRLIEDGWSIKKLHRRILLSATWRQASRHRARAAAVDAENNLFWRQNRRRRGFEGVRDSLLAAADTLNTKMGGPSVDLLTRPFAQRRAVYGFINRSSLPGLFSAFDFPSPDATSGGRSETMVPQQTLFMMNHHFVVECAGDLLRRIARTNVVSHTMTQEDRVRSLCRAVLARDPRPIELAAAEAFFVSEPDPRADCESWSYGRGRVDDHDRVNSFRPFQYWSGSSWSSTVDAPGTTSSGDPESPAAIFLDLTGGTTCPAGEPSVIRRWTAPTSLRITVEGKLVHDTKTEPAKDGKNPVPETSGDGVHARLISSRQGVLGRWKAHESQVTTDSATVEVVSGETLDFVVDGCQDGSDDRFDWPVLIYVMDNSDRREHTARWDSREDFRGPQADMWQQFAQALLMTNEFIFVD